MAADVPELYSEAQLDVRVRKPTSHRRKIFLALTMVPDSPEFQTIYDCLPAWVNHKGSTRIMQIVRGTLKKT